VTLIVDAVITGIMAGGVYALMASGLTLIFGVLGIINIAQGMFVVLGAYLSYTLSQVFHLDILLGLLITMPVMFCLGVFIEWAFIRRLKTDRASLSILVTFAIALAIEGILGVFYGGEYVSLHAWYVDAALPLAGFYLPYIDIFAFMLSVILLGALFFLLYQTRFGYSIRASMQNRSAAMLIGINVSRVQSITFGIGVALAAAGGMAFGATNVFNTASSYDLISRLLVIIVLGGLGSLRGALLASVAMLVVGNVTAVVWSPTWSTLVFFALLALLLLFRPQGLFGRAEGRRQ
jgi:branched-chain amino acid transport system permease protein